MDVCGVYPGPGARVHRRTHVYGRGFDTETPQAGAGSLSFFRFCGFLSFSFGSGRFSYTPGPILESAFLWRLFCRQNLPVPGTQAYGPKQRHRGCRASAALCAQVRVPSGATQGLGHTKRPRPRSVDTFLCPSMPQRSHTFLF
jgi:hypothetical protein